MQQIGELNPSLHKRPYLYRIELLDRFYKMLDNQQIVFVNPDKWEDPLENLIFNAKVIKDGKPYQNPAKHSIFSQCWSYEGDSYGIWKIYTTKADDEGIVKRHMGVRITTHLDRLVHLSKMNGGQFYYGLVNYLPKYKMDKLPGDDDIRRALSITKPSLPHLETLLLKRKSYAYEREIRLFAIPSKKYIDPQQKFLCRLRFKPTDFISSLRFDPGMEYSEFQKHQTRLIEQYGFRKSQITQSTYFKKNKYVINLDK